MITDNMTLRQMLDFKPTDYDMALLPLNVTVYIKVTAVSDDKMTNYNFIRHLFAYEDISNEFDKLSNTTVFDFDGLNTSGNKFVSLFELYSIYNYDHISDLLKEILETYDHEADILIDFFTHDSRMYRLSNLDGIVKLEEVNEK